MVVTGLDFSFLSMMSDIVITEIDEKVHVVLALGDNNVLDETYYPDADGKVVISELDKLLGPYFKLPALDLNLSIEDTEPALVMKCSGSFTDNTELTLKTYCNIMYASQPVDKFFLESMTKKFFTHIRSKKTKVDRSEFFSFLAADQKIYLGVAFRQGKDIKYVRNLFQDHKSGSYYCTCMINADVIMQELEYYTEYSISPSDIIYFEIISNHNGIDQDKIRYEIDDRNFIQQTNLIYRNCFGVPETITFTGTEERDYEMSGSFAWVDGFYSKYDTKVIMSNEVNSGYITKELASCIEDLIVSDKVYLYSNNIMGHEIVITDVNMKCIRPNNAGVSYTITYRPVSYKRMPFTTGAFKRRNFDKTFNHTFD